MLPLLLLLAVAGTGLMVAADDLARRIRQMAAGRLVVLELVG
jgi:hypothetical protein